jgi:RNA polymerase sigma factor for flagellar operon FliA
MSKIGMEINLYQEILPLPLTDEETEIREELILKYAPLVKRIAEKLAIRLPDHISKDDLVSSGVIGLLEAIDNYDDSKGIKFETYASYRIRGAILDELRKMDWVPRSVRKEIQRIEKAIIAFQRKEGRQPDDDEIAREMGVDIESYFMMINKAAGVNLLSLDHPLRGDADSFINLLASQGTSAFDELKRNELKAVIAKELSNLSKKDQLVLSLYYYDDLTLKEIAEIMELSESRISQIHTKAIVTLNARLKAYHDV